MKIARIDLQVIQNVAYHNEINFELKINYFINCRNNMSRWTLDRSVLLSLLLDEVTGTQNAIEIRQDFCKIKECLRTQFPIKIILNQYYTGSRAEGLDLPGSDDDYMNDMNVHYGNIKVVQSPFLETSDMSAYTILYLRTETTSPCFALLQMKENYPLLEPESEMINGVRYLSSNLIVQSTSDAVRSLMSDTMFIKRQGPIH